MNDFSNVNIKFKVERGSLLKKQISNYRVGKQLHNVGQVILL